MSNIFAYFELENFGPLWVRRQCPACGRLLKTGIVHVSWYDGHIVAIRWMCKAHGEVKPEVGWNEPPYPEP